jgi:LysM repeat protein
VSIAGPPQPTLQATAAATITTTTTTSTTTTAQASAQPPSATAAAQVAASGPFRAYRVQPGDTVKFVAQMYGVSPASIIQASGLQNPDVLRVGQVLTVPAAPGWLYRVQAGETLDLIAARTGVPAERIANASNLTAASVTSGDVILIPDQAQARSK